MTSAPSREKCFAAFISYRHLPPDMQIARKLFRLLEHNHARPSRRVPRRIRPVFIDVGELPITADLSESLRVALRESECLFVVCSPNISLSPYCLKEIEYFKELHGGRLDRVYTILAAGDPKDAFPEVLRFEIRDGVRVEVEPLFADVRADTLGKSMRLLRREYLRLAAGYYRCSFDELYKRHRRWIVRIVAGFAATAVLLTGGFLMFARARQVQYARAKAETYAGYADQCARAEDEILAMVLALTAYDAGLLSGSDRLTTVLRSAAVQHAYKLGALPVARVMTASYEDASGTVYYLGKGGGQILIADVTQDVGYTVFDTRTGARVTDYAFDRIFASTTDLSILVSVGARADADGITKDYYALYKLPENTLVAERAFRETTGETPSYSLVTSGNFNLLMDGSTPVAYFDDAGTDYDKDAFAQALISRGERDRPDGASFRIEMRSIKLRRKLCIVDAMGDVVLELPDEHALTAFSTDYAFFACLYEGSVHVYRTDAWEEVGLVDAPAETIWRIDLYGQPRFVSVTVSENGKNVTIIYDWKTGAKVTQVDNFPQVADDGASFYTVSGGVLSGYHYNADALGEKADVVAQAGERFLLRSAEGLALVDRGESLFTLKEDGGKARFDDTLTHVLIPTNGRLTCYGTDGAALWTAAGSFRIWAVSEDGVRAALMDNEGTVRVLDGASGTELYVYKPAAEDVLDMAVSRDGVLIVGASSVWHSADGAETTLQGGTYGLVTRDELLIVRDAWAYADDFAVYSTNGALVYKPSESTGAYDYSPASGYLVRQPAASGGHPTNTLEILKRGGSGFTMKAQIELTSTAVSVYLDETGHYLTVNADGGTRIYALDEGTCLLDVTDCILRFENGALYANEARNGALFSCAFFEGKALEAYAHAETTSQLGSRTLTSAEAKRYPFTDD